MYIKCVKDLVRKFKKFKLQPLLLSNKQTIKNFILVFPKPWRETWFSFSRGFFFNKDISCCPLQFLSQSTERHEECKITCDIAVSQTGVCIVCGHHGMCPVDWSRVCSMCYCATRQIDTCRAFSDRTGATFHRLQQVTESDSRCNQRVSGVTRGSRVKSVT